MSYLNLPRLTFAGAFQADVNTVNNDVRNYDCRVFEPRLQTSQVTLPDGNMEYNGWWNPDGSNAFRLLECAVTGAVAPSGAAVRDDPVLSLELDAQRGRTATKIVDLDPQFQFASGLWGMRIFLSAGADTFLAATLRPTCFRDIYFMRLIDQKSGQPVQRSPGASARFTGVLEQIEWGARSASSQLLRELKSVADANGGRLQLSLMTYGYTRDPNDKQSFTFGSVIGSIGPWHKGEPLLFAPGRRFAPASSSPNLPFASSSGIGYMNAAAAPDGALLSVDFGNSLPLLLADQSAPAERAPIEVKPLGPLSVVVLKDADQVGTGPQGELIMAPTASEGDALAPDRYETIAVLTDYDMAWLKRTGGIADLPVPPAARALLPGHPLAILSEAAPGVRTIAIRETIGGVWVRADDFVQRVDAAPSGWVSSSVALYPMRFGQPWSGAPIQVSLSPESKDDGGTGDPNEVKPPQTTIPPINVPAEKFYVPASLTSGADGVATLTYAAENPDGVRRYIDGQIFEIAYSIAAIGQSPMPTFELVAAHVRDAYVPPEVPSWETDLAPILIQYGNLYPVMSRGLFSFSDPEVLAANARLLQLAFTLPIEDPNYMPATRDLSAGKARTIVKWLASFLPGGGPVDYGAIPPLPVGGPKPASAATVVRGDHASQLTPEAAESLLRRLGADNEGKNAALRAFLRGRTGRR